METVAQVIELLNESLSAERFNIEEDSGKAGFVRIGAVGFPFDLSIKADKVVQIRTSEGTLSDPAVSRIVSVMFDDGGVIEFHLMEWGSDTHFNFRLHFRTI